MPWSCADDPRLDKSATWTGVLRVLRQQSAEPASILGCIECGSPTFSYSESAPTCTGKGTMSICNSGTSFDYTAVKIGTSESVPEPREAAWSWTGHTWR